MTVKATREGLVGRETASGYVIDTVVPFVALPSTKALGKAVRIANALNGNTCVAIVLDVGPFNEHDDAYVFGGAWPLAETQTTGGDGAPSNGSGIDLGEKALGAPRHGR